MIEQSKFVLVICDDVFVISKLHNRYLVFLAFLTEIINISVSIFQQLTAFTNLILKTRTFILEPNSHFSNFSVYHRFALTVHHGSKVFKLLGFTALWSLKASFPLVYFLKKIRIFVSFWLILLFEAKVDIIQFVLEHFVLMVESFTDFV